jgi:hypothetical protein
VPLTLISAFYEDGTSRLLLEFDRPIDIAGYNGAAILVNDGAINGVQYDGQGGITPTGPASVEIALVEVQVWSGPDVRLNATPISGIVAVDDGGTWPGVTNLLLPFP